MLSITLQAAVNERVDCEIQHEELDSQNFQWIQWGLKLR